MKPLLLFALISTFACLESVAQIGNGEEAPGFKITDSNGQVLKLSDYKGKFIVLEWTNVECPLVKKHYQSNNIPRMQKELAAEGVIWLTIISSAKGKMGYCTPAQANAFVASMDAAPAALLLDTDGAVGRLFGAKVTPQMFIIDRAGRLRYQGALDSDNSVDPTTIPDSENYVKKALQDLFAGRPVSKPVTKPYGCSVKY